MEQWHSNVFEVQCGCGRSWVELCQTNLLLECGHWWCHRNCNAQVQPKLSEWSVSERGDDDARVVYAGKRDCRRQWLYLRQIHICNMCRLSDRPSIQILPLRCPTLPLPKVNPSPTFVQCLIKSSTPHRAPISFASSQVLISVSSYAYRETTLTNQRHIHHRHRRLRTRSTLRLPQCHQHSCSLGHPYLPLIVFPTVTPSHCD